MNNTEQTSAGDQLSEIRRVMEQSTRFLSLSGASGIFTGLAGLIASGFIFYSKKAELEASGFFHQMILDDTPLNNQLMSYFTMAGSFTIIISFLLALVFTIKKAKADGKEIWTAAGKNMFFHLIIPLAAGGLFCMILMFHRVTGLLIPSTLIFYGIALVSASKYTFKDIYSLGIIEIILGLIASVYVPYGLMIWALGFGLLHIIYGSIMYRKHEK